MRLRYERKYLVPNELLDALRRSISPFVRPDVNADEEAALPMYTVRSIYFDSPDWRALDEKMEGLRDRKKLRVRGYDDGTSDSIIFLEVKRKIGDRIAKNRSRLPFRYLEQILEFGDCNAHLVAPEEEGDDAKRFLFNYHRYGMQPAQLVVYDREPYHGIFDPGLRITLDKNIRTRLWPRLTDLYSDTDFAQPWASHFILEVKYFDDTMPAWVRALLQDFQLRHQALSKYAEGLLRQASKMPYLQLP